MPDGVRIDDRLGPGFRGSTVYERPTRSFAQMIGDYIDIGSFARFNKKRSSVGDGDPGHNISSNKEFWRSVLSNKLRSGTSVRLESFHLVEWVPIAPGRYFTHGAEFARRQARPLLSRRYDEFLPLGKFAMLLGGVGTCRFTPKSILERDRAIVCATDNGICHQGIPIILRLDDAQDLLSRIARDGSVAATVDGRIWALSERESPIAFDRQMPRFYLFADKIRYVRRDPVQLTATIAVLSATTDAPNDARLGDPRHDALRGMPADSLWTFASFDPRTGDHGVEQAANWMLEYTHRHQKEASTVVCDFDETRNWFPGSIDFPLQELIRGIVDQRRLEHYARICDFRVKTRVFLSYRRTDFPSIEPIYEALVEKLGHRHVFLDNESIPLGRDFRNELQERIDQCDSMVALIGPGWSGQHENGSLRIDEENDWVRQELELPLRLGKRIIPVVVGGQRFPPSELPESLKEISHVQALSISSLAEFLPGLNKLVQAIMDTNEPVPETNEPDSQFYFDV